MDHVPEPVLFRHPAIFESFPGLVAAESLRHGGVSPPPYASLNLGKSTGDDPENVAENRRRFCAALGIAPGQLAWSRQVHAAAVHLATTPGGVDGFDALITRTPGLMLAVSVADCTPVLVYDPRQQAVAAIHAGWRGAAAGVVSAALEAMAGAFGTRGEDCLAYVGTCIDECSYEVGAEVVAHFPPGLQRYDADRDRYFVDLKKACTAQLLAFGVLPDRIGISPYSTVLHGEDYFSHRLERGVTGRMMALIGLR